MCYLRVIIIRSTWNKTPLVFVKILKSFLPNIMDVKLERKGGKGKPRRCCLDQIMKNDDVEHIHDEVRLRNRDG